MWHYAYGWHTYALNTPSSPWRGMLGENISTVDLVLRYTCTLEPEPTFAEKNRLIESLKVNEASHAALRIPPRTDRGKPTLVNNVETWQTYLRSTLWTPNGTGRWAHQAARYKVPPSWVMYS
jgi:hypothetical protein